jgi:valyl-tRNA synthetase
MLRQTYGVPLQQNVAVELRVTNEATRALLEQHLALVTRSARISATVTAGGPHVDGAAKALVGTDVEIVMPLGGLIDPATESKRLEKDIAKVDKEIQQLEGKLANQAFLSRAPEDVVTEIRDRLAEEQTRRGRLLDARQTLTGATS